MQSYDYNGATMMEQLRRKPLIFCFGFTIVFFYVSPSYLPDTSYLNFPDIYKNGNYQEWMALSVWEQESHPDYVVYSPGCKIMDMNPFDDMIDDFWKKEELKKCEGGFSKFEKQKLTIDKKVTDAWEVEELKCCYRSIHRVHQDPNEYDGNCDSKNEISTECYDIPLGSQGTILNETFIKVECKGGKEENITVEFQASALPPNIMSNETKKKADYWDERKTQGLFHDPPSILIMGVDAISRMHMTRSIPRTKALLLKNDFIEMKGYNKVGLNTFPNMMAAMGGLENDNYTSCWPNSSVKMDDCPFVWKDFNKLNYMTSFVEDAPEMAIFNYIKSGFVIQPADYYMRPFMLARRGNKMWGRNKEKCTGGTSLTEFMVNYVRELVVNMGKDYPYFHFSWFTQTTHDSFNGITTVDEMFYNFFKMALNKEKANPNNTIMVFLSDHGFRYGSFRETFMGYYEESLPFFFFRIPPPIKERYPEWYANLRRNSGKLTSPLDFYMTLKQIGYEVNAQVKTSDEKMTSISSIRDYFKSEEEAVEQEEKQSRNFESGVHSFFRQAVGKDQGKDDQSPRTRNKVDSRNYYNSLKADNKTNSEHSNPQYRQRYSFFEYIPNNRTCESASIPQKYCMCGVTPDMSTASSLSSHMGEIVIKRVNHKLRDVIKLGECMTLNFSRFVYGREVGHGEVWDNFNQFINYTDYVVALEAKPSEAHFEARVRVFRNSSERILGDISRVNSYEGQSGCVSNFKLKPFCYCEKYDKDKKEREEKEKKEKEERKKKEKEEQEKRDKEWKEKQEKEEKEKKEKEDGEKGDEEDEEDEEKKKKEDKEKEDKEKKEKEDKEKKEKEDKEKKEKEEKEDKEKKDKEKEKEDKEKEKEDKEKKEKEDKEKKEKEDKEKKEKEDKGKKEKEKEGKEDKEKKEKEDKEKKEKEKKDKEKEEKEDKEKKEKEDKEKEDKEKKDKEKKDKEKKDKEKKDKEKEEKEDKEKKDKEDKEKDE